jgi:hypothetical protein
MHECRPLSSVLDVTAYIRQLFCTSTQNPTFLFTDKSMLDAFMQT